MLNCDPNHYIVVSSTFLIGQGRVCNEKKTLLFLTLFPFHSLIPPTYNIIGYARTSTCAHIVPLYVYEHCVCLEMSMDDLVSHVKPFIVKDGEEEQEKKECVENFFKRCHYIVRTGKE